MKLNKLSVSSSLLLALLMTISGTKTLVANEVSPYDNLKVLLTNYYNNGEYKKNTKINVDVSEIKEDLASYFHAKASSTNRTTYYKNDALWMSRGNGEYSYYGTAYEGDTPVGVTNTSTNMPLLNPLNPSVVLNGQYKNSMEEYYCTLKDFIEGSHISAHTNNKELNLTSDWTYADGVYTSTNNDVLDGFRLFTAPLWLGKTLENENYITYTKATIEEVDSNLVMKLWVSSTNEGQLVSDAETDGTDSVFSQAVVTKKINQNLQEVMRTDFEGFTNHDISITEWNLDFGNFGQGNVDINCDGDNAYTKLSSKFDGGSSTITKACNTNVLKAGTYRLEFDAKIIGTPGTLSFGIWDGINWIPGWKLPMNTSNVNSIEWTKVSYEYTIPVDQTGVFANLDIDYLAPTTNDSILIDNIRIVDASTGLDVDLEKNNNFDAFVIYDYSLSTSGWRRDAFGDVIYIGDKHENTLLEENNNTVVKMYTSNSDHTSLTFAGNRDIAKAGIYTAKLKVKLGAGATNVDNIGFRFSSENPIGTVDMMFDGLNTLSSEEWVTLEHTFIINQDTNVGWLNIDLWVFTHNDLINSVDNYVLIDNLEINRIY